MNTTTSLHRWILLLIFCGGYTHLLSQAFYSTTGMALGKLRAKQAIIPQPEEVVVEEYMNYHTHMIPMPEQGEAVHMDLQWGYPDLDEPVLMVGITTPLLSNMEEAAPLNLSLVIDRSGSMSGDRINNAKKALRKLTRSLRPTDVVSLIAFDHESFVMHPAQLVGDGEALFQAINRLEVRGSTDLNRGILTGYRELLKYYDASRTNRLLILTDAITNTGVVDPNHIIGNSKEFEHTYEVDCAMICLGSNFQHELAREFTKSGRHSFHFVDDEEDLQKVFVDEVQGLLAPVATDPVLEIQFDPRLEIETFYGYEPIIQGNHIRLPLNQMNHGLTQVIMIKFHQKSGFPRSSPSVEANLHYFDVKKGKKHHLTASQALPHSHHHSALSPHLEHHKSYAIAVMAQGLKDMAIAHHNGQSSKAQAIVQETLDNHHRMISIGQVAEDADVSRVESILSSYAEKMNQHLSSEEYLSDY
ncbi:MAG: VWA domain-containing protein [Bacteroidota bacterium]